MDTATYLATCDLVANSSVFIEDLISRQPMYLTSNVTPSLIIACSIVWNTFVDEDLPLPPAAAPPPPPPPPYRGILLVKSVVSCFLDGKGEEGH